MATETNVISAQDLPKTDEELTEILTDLTLPAEVVELAEIEQAVSDAGVAPDLEYATMQLAVISNSDLIDGFIFQQPENLRDAYVAQFDFGPDNVKVVWHGYLVGDDLAPDND